MTDLQSIKSHASRIDAIISCPECDFEEYFEAYLERDDRVSEEGQTVEFGCPACESNTVGLGKEVVGTTTIIVESIGELEEIAGE